MNLVVLTVSRTILEPDLCTVICPVVVAGILLYCRIFVEDAGSGVVGVTTEDVEVIFIPKEVCVATVEGSGIHTVTPVGDVVNDGDLTGVKISIVLLTIDYGSSVCYVRICSLSGCRHESYDTQDECHYEE